MSDISRTEHQKVVEENKRLRIEIASISMLDDKAMEILMDWRKSITTQAKASEEVENATLNFLEKYRKKVPDELKMNRRKIYEIVECECGHECPIEYATIDEDGCWTCANCTIENLVTKSEENA